MTLKIGQLKVRTERNPELRWAIGVWAQELPLSRTCSLQVGRFRILFALSDPKGER